MHGLNIKSDIELPIPSYFKVRSLKKADLTIKVGESSTKGMKLVAPPYLYFKNRKIVHKYGFAVPCSISIENLEDYNPQTSAVAFKGGMETVYVRRTPRFRIGDEIYGPFFEETAELPVAVAVFLLCKKAARLAP